MNETQFSGYYGIVLENMVIPIALFLSREQAIEWAADTDMKGAEVREYRASSELFALLSQQKVSV